MSRTLVNLNDDLLARAMRETGLSRKVDVVNEALRVLVAQKKVERLLDAVKGRVAWEGSADEMRHGGARSR